MNKTLFLTILTLTFSTLVFSQPQSGINLGLNYTSVKNDKSFNYESKFGFDIGYQQAFKLTERWYATLGIMYNKYNLGVESTQNFYSVIKIILLIILISLILKS